MKLQGYNGMGIGPSTSGENLPGGDVPAGDSITDSIVNTISKSIPLWQQIKTFNAQLDIEKRLAKQQGRSIDAGNLSVPGIPVNVGLDSNTKMMIGFGIGAIALILLMQRKGR